MYPLRETLITQKGKVNKEFPKLGKLSAASVLDRLHLVYGVDNDNQLAERLQVNRSTMGNWRSRDSVPYTICVSASLARGYSLDWLLTGEGPQRREEGVVAPDLSASEQAILALYRALDEGAQREIQSAAEEKKRLIDIERRLDDLSAEVAQARKPA